MKISTEWLEKVEACPEARKWFQNQTETDAVKVARKLIGSRRLDWCNWGLSRALDQKNKIRYAVFAAEQVIDLFERQYPDDKRARKAIAAAKKVLKLDTPKSRAAAASAAAAAAYAASSAAAFSAAAAAYAASSAAVAAASSAAAAAAYAASSAAVAAASSAVAAASAAAASSAASSSSSAAAAAAYAAAADAVFFSASASVFFSAADAGKDVELKIIEYGISLLKKQ